MSGALVRRSLRGGSFFKDVRRKEQSVRSVPLQIRPQIALVGSGIPLVIWNRHQCSRADPFTEEEVSSLTRVVTSLDRSARRT